MTDDRFEEEIAAIRDDRASGASELARRALTNLAQSARTAGPGEVGKLRKGLCDRAEALSAVRPSMAPLVTLTHRFRDALNEIETDDTEEFLSSAADCAETLIHQSRTAGKTAARKAANLIGPRRHVLTISDSSTVRATLEDLAPDATVTVAEARPLCEGASLAERLADAGVGCTLITDAQMAVAARDADCALIGADTILPDGSAINKAGSHLLALAAREAGIPFYVVAESFKRLPDGHALPVMEEMAASELGYPEDTGYRVRNIYFEAVPATLISELITEE